MKAERELTSKLKLAYDKINSELIEERGKSKKLASMLFGLKSEKMKLADIDLEDAVVCEQEKVITEKEKRLRGSPAGHTGNGRIIPDNLPIVDIVIEPEESALICEKCGKVADVKNGLESVSYQVAMKKQYYLKKVIRRTYASTCTCNVQSSLIRAPPMTQIIPKGKYTDDSAPRMHIMEYEKPNPPSMKDGHILNA